MGQLTIEWTIKIPSKDSFIDNARWYLSGYRLRLDLGLGSKQVHTEINRPMSRNYGRYHKNHRKFRRNPHKKPHTDL